MTTKQELMGSGMPAAQASKLGQDVPNASLTATGSGQSDALALTASYSVFSTVGSSTGALLPSAHGRDIYVVVNNGANALTVYPATGEKINALSANTGFSVTNGKQAIFIGNNNQWAGILSA